MASTINASTSSGLVATADTSGVLQLQTGGTAAVTVDASQKVGIGTSSPSQKLTVAVADAAQAAQFRGSTGYVRFRPYVDATNGAIIDATNAAESAYSTLTVIGSTLRLFGGSASGATIDSSGNLLVGQTAQTTTERVGVTFIGNNNGAYFYNTSASPTGTGVTVNYGNVTGTNTTTCFLFTGRTAGTDRFYVYGNGGIANYQANNVNLSDRREKTNFAPAKSYLDAICAIPVQTFNYIDQSEDDLGLTLGVVAQDVQAVAPELVSESNWGTEAEPKTRLSIYQTDLQYALMKCIQELKAEVDSLKAKLEAKP